eukprot:scaffold113506_cov33-Tisochrysis_lutea.AAC.4
MPLTRENCERGVSGGGVSGGVNTLPGRSLALTVVRQYSASVCDDGSVATAEVNGERSSIPGVSGTMEPRHGSAWTVTCMGRCGKERGTTAYEGG